MKKTFNPFEILDRNNIIMRITHTYLVGRILSKSLQSHRPSPRRRVMRPQYNILYYTNATGLVVHRDNAQ